MFDVRPGSSAPLAAFVLVNGLLVSSLATLVSDPAMMKVRRPDTAGSCVDMGCSRRVSASAAVAL